MAKWSPKDPEDVRDYWVDFTSLLAEGETITAAAVTVPDEIEKVSDSFTDTMVRARFSGGTTAKYGIGFHITTSIGQQFDLTKTLEVKERTA
jgi:hypothetical protein